MGHKREVILLDDDDDDADAENVDANVVEKAKKMSAKEAGGANEQIGECESQLMLPVNLLRTCHLQHTLRSIWCSIKAQVHRARVNFMTMCMLWCMLHGMSHGVLTTHLLMHPTPCSMHDLHGQHGCSWSTPSSNTTMR